MMCDTLSYKQHERGEGVNMNENKTITLTSEQYGWVKAIASDTYKEACHWFYDTQDDGSENYKRKASYNGLIRDLAEQVIQVQPNA